MVVHAWYPEVLDEILHALLASGQEFRLLVTTSPEKAAAVSSVLARHGIAGEIIECENRGRDILPFLRVASRLLNEGERVLLKLHTKQSLHRPDGQAWRRELLERLLPPAHTPRILEAFVNDETLGIVAPEGHVQPMDHYWGANEDAVRYLATRIGIEQPRTESDRFVAGSMFWLRIEALRPLLDAHLDEWEFEPEEGQVDGTFAHALERVFMLSARHAGYHTATTSSLDRQMESRAQPYPYARRG